MFRIFKEKKQPKQNEATKNMYDINKKFIKKTLMIALETNDFDKFVMMNPAYSVKTRDLNGFVKPNRYFTMNAIYEYYNENLNSKIDEKLFDTLIDISKKYKGEGAVEAVLDTVEFQLDYEKKGLAPFKIDCQAVLNELRNSLLKNKDMYLQKKEAFNYVPFWNEIEDYNDRLQEKHGHKVL